MTGYISNKLTIHITLYFIKTTSYKTSAYVYNARFHKNMKPMKVEESIAVMGADHVKMAELVERKEQAGDPLKWHSAMKLWHNMEHVDNAYAVLKGVGYAVAGLGTLSWTWYAADPAALQWITANPGQGYCNKRRKNTVNCE